MSYYHRHHHDITDQSSSHGTSLAITACREGPSDKRQARRCKRPASAVKKITPATLCTQSLAAPRDVAPWLKKQKAVAVSGKRNEDSLLSLASVIEAEGRVEKLVAYQLLFKGLASRKVKALNK